MTHGGARRVRFAAGCFVRVAPGRGGAVLGVMKRGQSLPARGEQAGGWQPVVYRGLPGWVSERFLYPTGTNLR